MLRPLWAQDSRPGAWFVAAYPQFVYSPDCESVRREREAPRVTTVTTNESVLSDALTAPVSEVEKHMARIIDERALPSNLDEAVRYAALAGGKRLRPLLVIHSCAAVGGELDHCLPSACAVEMIHAFSLVHDDLPALDNDDLRRGRPTLHVAYTEAMAILAGDALMSIAFQSIGDDRHEPATAGLLLRELATGSTDMIAGQVYDTLGGFPDDLTEEQRLRLVHGNKTGALIQASCRMGAISGMLGAKHRLDSAMLARITEYAEAIGLMFQVVDDLLDVEQTTEHLGKRASKDEDAGKLTYPGVLGVEGSRAIVKELEHKALQAIAPFDKPAEPLRHICRYLATRTR